MNEGKVLKGYSLFMNSEEYEKIFGGQVSENFIAGFLFSKLKPVYGLNNPPKGAGQEAVKPAVEEKAEEEEKGEEAPAEEAKN